MICCRFGNWHQSWMRDVRVRNASGYPVSSYHTGLRHGQMVAWKVEHTTTKERVKDAGWKVGRGGPT
jgi:hypothetical protein